jgi:lysophospholipase L1-like esterase
MKLPWGVLMTTANFGNRRAWLSFFRAVWMSRHVRLLFSLIVGLSLNHGAVVRAAEPGHWVGAWSAAAVRAPIEPNIQLRQPPSTLPLHMQTVREFVSINVSGNLLRIHLDNRYGKQAIHFGRVTIARASMDGSDAIDPSSLSVVTYRGATHFVLPPGGAIDSDAIRMKAVSGERLALSLYVSDSVEPASWHPDSRYKQSLSAPGDHSGDQRFADAQSAAGYDWLTRIDVFAGWQTQAIVLLGDSITNGYHASPGHSYPEQLAERLRNNRCTRSVLSAGIDGNQVAAGLGNFGQGDRMLDRLPYDVLDVPGLRDVFVFGGINDIGEPTMAARNANKPLPDAKAMAESVIAALQAIATRLKARGLRVYGATLLPFEGTQGAYTPPGEAARQMINAWIRHEAPYDAVVDFDAVMRDDVHPTRMQARYDSGDHIHPNDTGYRAMADAIPLALLGCAEAASHIRSPRNK